MLTLASALIAVVGVVFALYALTIGVASGLAAVARRRDR